jgi:hypothetical protein
VAGRPEAAVHNLKEKTEMTLPDLPVTLALKTVTATKNGEVRFAEPYLLTLFFKVDGETMTIVQRADGKLALNGNPTIRKTASRHGNLPEIRDGQTVNVPANVGRTTFAMRPIPLPGDLAEVVVGGASGVAGMLYVLAEEDAVSDQAILAGYDALVAQFTAELKGIVSSIVIDPAAPGASPFDVSTAVKEAITERIKAKVKDAILANSNLIQKLGLLVDKDDILGTDVLIFSETSLLADRSQPFSKRFDVGIRGDWRVAGSADATVPRGMAARRRVTVDLAKLTCVTGNEGAVLGGDEPYMWNVFFTVDGSSVALGENLALSGQAVVATTPGSHGNLAAAGVQPGQTIEVPDAVGRSAQTLDLIPFPPSLAGSLVGGISGVTGCVSVLLEQDLVAASAAEAGHQAFNDEITRVLNELIPTLGVGNSTPSPDDLAALSGQIGDKVRAAIVEEGNLLQDLFAGVDPDDVVGFNVFLFSHRDLLAQPQQTFSASYGDAGRYDVTGTVTAVGV